MLHYYQMSRFAVFALVLLRVCVGWHFFMEGQAKVKEGGFSSGAFLGAAKGPLAEIYHSAIWDHDGKIRLDKPRIKMLFEDFAKDAAKKYVFTDEQKTELAKIEKKYVGELTDVFDQYSEEVFKFEKGIERKEEMNQDPKRLFVASLRGQAEKIERDRMTAVKPALASIDKVWVAFEKDVTKLATPEQKQALLKPVAIAKPEWSPFHADTIDQILPYFDMVIGILLIVGLLTPIASLAAGLFLTSVVFSQFPGFPGTQPTYFHAVEAIACFFLFAADAGRYAGLDFIPYSIWRFISQSSAKSAKAKVA